MGLGIPEFPDGLWSRPFFIIFSRTVYLYVTHTYCIHEVIMAYEKQKRIIESPVVGDFKGNKTLSIPFGKENEAFTFGVVKAKAILRYMTDIQRFVEESDREYAAKQGGQKTW